MCVAILPLAWMPLWQLAQEPGATLAWVKRAGDHALAEWQVLQLSVVGTWLAGLAVAA